MLAHLDDSVGQVNGQLRESGVEENTLIVFLSDNGGPTKELTSSNAPLHDGKGQLWEGGIRVPYVVSWKGHITAIVIDAPVMSLGLTATALDLGGGDSSKARLDGINLLPVWTDKPSQSPDRTLFWRVGNKNALRSGDWKLIRGGNDWQLYNLADDSCETLDLASKEPARVQQMSKVWDQWNAQ